MPERTKFPWPISPNLMQINTRVLAIFGVLLAILLTACGQSGTAPPADALPATAALLPSETPRPTPTATVTPAPPRVLSVCLGQEPSSLFLYGDTTSSAQSVRQAIYDGPFDFYNYEIQPVILKEIPSLANGGASLRPVDVAPGTLIVDADGNWVALDEDVRYRPSGCSAADCVQTYTGDEPVEMDELAVQFQLLPDLRWADGTALTAYDSIYSFFVLKQLYAESPPEIIRFTQSYQALDDLTAEWVSIPGYQGEYATHFFTPLPQHLWGAFPPADLLTAEISARSPLGWGPYQIDEWVSGDHITLSRNPNYWRADDGLPAFDILVFRFNETPESALNALLAGECDFVDRSAGLDDLLPRVLELQAQGQITAVMQAGTAWEQLTFGIQPISQASSLFASKEIRQAAAYCLDREAIARSVYGDAALVPDTFLPVGHPLQDTGVVHYDFDLQKADELLRLAGWIDHDGNPDTPRIAADGTPFEFVLLAPEDGERPQVAAQIAASLAQCGLRVEVQLQGWGDLLKPGPEGLIFGRQFDLAQFAWAYAHQPACSLYRSDEIPGSYPEYPKGWGGGNAAGFSDPDFDRLCAQAYNLPPDTDAYRAAYLQMQAIFADELPALPLYQRLKPVAARPDMCGLQIDAAFGSALSALEDWNYGENCP